MYAYGNVIIERPRVWALPRAALDHEGDKTFYWTCRDDRAVRTEVRTGVGDDEWVEVTSRRALQPHGDQSWTPIDGSAQVILGELSALADGEPVRIAAAEQAKTPGVN